MKVITIESSAFRALTEQIAEIAAHVRAVTGERKEEPSDRLLTTREAARLLNVSTRTLQRMRNEQRIGYVVCANTANQRLTVCSQNVQLWRMRPPRQTSNGITHYAQVVNPKEGGHKIWNCLHETILRTGCRN